VLMTTRLRVMIDARMLIGRFSGVARVVTRLIDALARREDIAVTALCGDQVFPDWQGRRDMQIVSSSFGRRDRTPARRYLWEETHLRKIIRRAGVDVFHATWNSGVPARCPAATVLTVHDLIPWRNPSEHFTTAAQRFFHRRAVRSSIRRADLITTVSEYVRGQVLDTFGIDPSRIVTVPNGVDMPTTPDLSESTRAAGLSPRGAAPGNGVPPAVGPYVLYVGGHERRKNVAAVFAAMRSYWRRFDATLELRLTGGRESLCPEAARACEQLPGDSPLRFLGSPNDVELTRLYSGASALLMLSHDEGFGLPALEAMAHGCPVIAANNASLPEVVGDAGVLVQPENVEQIAETIHRLMTDAALRRELTERGLKRARNFSWTATAEGVLSAYQAALRLGRAPVRREIIRPATAQAFGAMSRPDR